MKKVIIPIADGFEEIETMTIVDVLRRAGVDVTLAGLENRPLKGSRQVQVVADTSLEEVKNQDFDMVVLPGGQPGVDNLRKDERVKALLQKMQSQDKLIGAICAAPLVLHDAGMIKDKKITSYPGCEGELTESRYETTRVVTDGKMITSRGPGTAMEFSLALVDILVGAERVAELKEALLVP